MVMNTLSVFHLGAWGFTIGLSAMLFTYIGRQIDVFFNTEPQFMLGLLILSVGMCIARLYKDAKDKKV
jgi:F0F1-type ATP synthase assembly protein I